MERFRCRCVAVLTEGVLLVRLILLQSPLFTRLRTSFFRRVRRHLRSDTVTILSTHNGLVRTGGRSELTTLPPYFTLSPIALLLNDICMRIRRWYWATRCNHHHRVKVDTGWT